LTMDEEGDGLHPWEILFPIEYVLFGSFSWGSQQPVLTLRSLTPTMIRSWV
jgi:hypothetical protein